MYDKKILGSLENAVKAGLVRKNPPRKNPPEKTHLKKPEKTQMKVGFFGFFQT